MPPGRKKGIQAFVTGLMTSSALTGLMAVTMLGLEIPVTTVLPTSAPIWMGFSTLFFMLLDK